MELLHRRTTLLLALVALLYVGAQTLLVDPARFVGYDEAIYLTQVHPEREPSEFLPHRARGITWLVAPVAGAPLPVVRLYLAAVSGVLLALAYGCWRPILGPAAAWAAGLYAVLWPAILYGSEVMPNHFGGLLAVAAAGLVFGRERTTGRHLAAAALLLAVAAAIRPTDATFVTLGLGLALVATRGRQALPALAVVGSGLALGWIPWLIEAQARFGGPLARLADASELHGGRGFNLLRHLALTDGPLLGNDPSLPWQGVAWWLTLAVLVTAAFRLDSDPSRRAALLGASLAGLGALIPYFFLTRGEAIGGIAAVIAPRFLLPAYGLLSVPAAVGLAAMAARLRAASGRRGRPAALAVVAILLLGVGWHAATAHRIGAEMTHRREAWRQVSKVLESTREGAPCLVAGSFVARQIEYGSACRSERFPLAAPATARRLRKAADRGRAVFVLSTSRPRPRAAASWTEVPVDARRGWRLYRVPPTVPPDDGSGPR